MSAKLSRMVQGLKKSTPAGGLNPFKLNPVRDEISAILQGNLISFYRKITNRRSGLFQLKVPVFPKSPDEANYPQKVKKNGN